MRPPRAQVTTQCTTIVRRFDPARANRLALVPSIPSRRIAFLRIGDSERVADQRAHGSSTRNENERAESEREKSVEPGLYELHASLRSPRCDRVISDDRLLIIPRLTSMTRARRRPRAAINRA